MHPHCECALGHHATNHILVFGMLCRFVSTLVVSTLFVSTLYNLINRANERGCALGRAGAAVATAVTRRYT
jgi:hypothetical protein